MTTITYYDINAQFFYDRTIGTDMSLMYREFLKFLPDNAHILDAGCGVGRDAKFFSMQAMRSLRLMLLQKWCGTQQRK
jgi:hypothetical protein